MEQRGWLPAAVRVVREGADRATEPGGVVETVPGDLVESGLAAVAWVAQAGPQRDRVRVRAASVTTPEWVSVPSDGPVARALEEDAVTHTSAVAETAVYGAVAEGEALPDVTAGLFVPFRALGQAGVLALLTDVPVPSEARETAGVLGAVLEDSLSLVESRADRERERARLEAIRSTVSHDLGSPLNLASGRLELARETTESDHLSHAMDALREIDAMASDAVRYVEAGEPVRERETVSVADAVGATWDSLETGESTLTTAPAEVAGDSARVHQLLSELLDNALAHTDGPVEVSVGPLSTQEGFYVADTGAGVPADEREFVFDRGYTTDPDRDGHGLAVAREVAGAHGWTLGLAESDSGARFEVVADRW